jgi:hypothetical protein
VHTSISIIIFYKPCAIATLKHLELVLSKNYIRIITFTFNLQRALFYSITVFLHYSTTIKLLLPTIFIKGCYLSLKASLLCWDVIISLIYAKARKFMQCRQADQYLQRERLPITASAKQPYTSYLSPALRFGRLPAISTRCWAASPVSLEQRLLWLLLDPTSLV